MFPFNQLTEKNWLTEKYCMYPRVWT